MTDSAQITAILNSSPSVELLRLRNREAILVLLVNTFANNHWRLEQEKIPQAYVEDYLQRALFPATDPTEQSEV